jgi:hypothetical protein
MDMAKQRIADLAAFMAQVQSASKIADPIECCLHMPDPPGSHWHANANDYVIRACVDKDTNSPNRYHSARDFLERFGNDPHQQGPATEIRTWLSAHPEPSTG